MTLPEDIECPSCGAKPGDPCLQARGQQRPPHAARLLGRERSHKKINPQPVENM